jgi:hypothetical protein
MSYQSDLAWVIEVAEMFRLRNFSSSVFGYQYEGVMFLRLINTRDLGTCNIRSKTRRHIPYPTVSNKEW